MLKLENTDDVAAAPVPELCPLDGAHTVYAFDTFVCCTLCHELLGPDETVTKATPETWAAYLLAGVSDTDPADAPLSRLYETPGAC